MAATLNHSIWYDVGDRVKLSVEVRDKEIVDEPLTDPDQLVFTIKEPDGSLTSYTYGVDGELVKDDVGIYHVAWDVVQAGVHWARFAASGNVGGAEERGFKVRPSNVL